VPSAYQQGAVRMCGGLVPAELALVDLGLHPGVVLRELGQLAAAQQVGAGVDDVHQGQLGAAGPRVPSATASNRSLA
jgi:hypothetical protein